LEKYPDFLAKRVSIIRKYNAMCDELGVTYLNHITESSLSSGHLYMTRIPGITLEERNCIIDELCEKGISTNVHYKPLPMMTAYKNLGFDISNYPNAYKKYENEITLPLNTTLTDEMVDYIIECYTKVIKEM
jgi:dTDP-4-amino-4,6-dideoxygalactose transaminase